MENKINRSWSYVDFRKKSVSYDLVENIIKTIKDKRDKAVFKLFIDAGLNPIEVVDLKKEDISKGKIIIQAKNTKNNTQRIVSIDENFCRELKSISGEEYIFSTKKSEKITLRTIHRILEKYSTGFGIKLTSGDLRKLFIQKLLKDTPIEKVKASVGLKRIDHRKYLSEEEIASLEKNITDGREEVIFNLLLQGLKPHEIVDLRLNHLTDKRISSSIVKKIKSISSQKVSTGDEFVFLTRQGSHLTTERVFQIIKQLGERAGISISPQILNNTSLASALSSKDPEKKLNKLGISTSAFHLHGGLYNDSS